MYYCVQSKEIKKPTLTQDYDLALAIAQATDDASILAYVNGVGGEDMSPKDLKKSSWSSVVLLFSKEKYEEIAGVSIDGVTFTKTLLEGPVGILGEPSYGFFKDEMLGLVRECTHTIAEDDISLFAIQNYFVNIFANYGIQKHRAYLPIPANHGEWKYVSIKEKKVTHYDEEDRDSKMYPASLFSSIQRASRQYANIVPQPTMIDNVSTPVILAEHPDTNTVNNVLFHKSVHTNSFYDEASGIVIPVLATGCRGNVKDILNYLFEKDNEAINEFLMHNWAVDGTDYFEVKPDFSLNTDTGELEPTGMVERNMTGEDVEIVDQSELISSDEEVKLMPTENEEEAHDLRSALEKMNVTIGPGMYTSNGTTVEFSDEGVKLSKKDTDNNGDVRIKTVHICKQKLFLIGVSKRPIENEGGHIWSFIYYNDDGNIAEIPLTSKVRDNNEMTKAYAFYFTCSDNDFQLFCGTLQRARNCPVFTIVSSNGHYDGYSVINNTVLYGTLPNYHILQKPVTDETARQLSHCVETDQKEVSIKEFHKGLTTLWKDNIVTAVFLSAITCNGMNLWNESMGNIFPSMFITGLTGAGKTTMGVLIKHALGYPSNYRKVAANSTTAQPLKELAGDRGILFLEEYTSMSEMKHKSAATILRNIINRADAQTGKSNGENIKFPMRSPLFIDGEQLPSEDSLLNRLMIYVLHQSDRKENKDGHDIINTYSKMSCAREVCKMYHEKRHRINKDAVRYQKKLTKVLMDSRIADVRAACFVVNSYLHLIDEEDLIETVKAQYRNMGLPLGGSGRGEDDTFMILQSILADAHLSRSMAIMRNSFEVGNTAGDIGYVVTVTFKKGFLNSHRASVVTTIDEAGIQDHCTIAGSSLQIGYIDHYGGSHKEAKRICSMITGLESYKKKSEAISRNASMPQQVIAIPE